MSVAPRRRKWSTTGTPSAPPSIGSVPDPTSSSSTSAGVCRLRSIPAMFAMCPEKVLRFASIDCSSPMSANTDRNTGTREPSAAGMRRPRGRQLERAIRQRRLDAVDRIGKTRACLKHVELGCDVNRPRQIRGARSKRVRQREQDATNFFGFLFFERDDVVVDFDRAERLEIEAGAACRRAVHDAGNRRAMLGLHDDHVPAVAFGDDLVLQILRGFFSAQIRLERAAEARSLLSQLLPNRLELRARAVDDFSRLVDLLADLSRFVLERRGGTAGRFEQERI